MQVLHERCCGLDVHKKSVTACILTSDRKEVRTFPTMTRSLRTLVDWIVSEQCTHVAMESTGVLWKPIFNLLELEDGVQPMVVNAQHIKAVPGRKTDVKDAEWIASLLRHGLLTASYIPSRDQRELRELVRYRRSIIEERTREINRIQKVLEGANIKLSSVASNVLGVSGRAMIEAMIHGINDPSKIAELAQKRLKNKKDDLILALEGVIGPHQRLMLSKQLRHIDELDKLIVELNQETSNRMKDWEEDIQRLDTIPGIGRTTAEQILAETGVDMSRWPSDAHFCSWAAMSPGNNQSAGKRKNEKTRKGNKKLRHALIEAAKAAAKNKDSYLSAQYHRIAARRGTQRASVAVGHTILKIIYHMLKRKQSYIELGNDYYDKRKKEMIIRHSVKRLEALGYTVNIQETA